MIPAVKRAIEREDLGNQWRDACKGTVPVGFNEYLSKTRATAATLARRNNFWNTFKVKHPKKEIIHGIEV